MEITEFICSSSKLDVVAWAKQQRLTRCRAERQSSTSLFMVIDHYRLLWISGCNRVQNVPVHGMPSARQTKLMISVSR